MGFSKDSPPVLRKIGFEVKRGEFVAIIGEVGSGKSSLMSALKGDMVNLEPVQSDDEDWGLLSSWFAPSEKPSVTYFSDKGKESLSSIDQNPWI